MVMLVYIIIAFSLFVTLIYTFVTVVYRKPTIKSEEISHYPKVSILKPIKSTDDELEKNLESFFEIDYPDFEIIFGVDSLDDDATHLIRQIIQKYPNIKAKIVPTGTNKILNPKVETLIVMAEQSSGTLYWVSDSNTRTEPEILKKLAHESVVNNSKIVFSPLKGTGSKTFGSIIENSYLNFYISGSIICSWKIFKWPVIIGKSMLIDKEALDGFGGFSRFKPYLAEDYIIGKTFKKNNVYISTNCTWVTNFNSHASIKNFCSRISRWGKMRFHIEKPIYMGEILANPIGLSLIAFIFLGNQALSLLIICVVVKVFCEYLNLFLTNGDDRKRIWIIFLYPFCIIVKDILLLLMYFLPFVNNKVTWRGKKIKIGKESRIRMES